MHFKRSKNVHGEIVHNAVDMRYKLTIEFALKNMNMHNPILKNRHIYTYSLTKKKVKRVYQKQNQAKKRIFSMMRASHKGWMMVERSW